MWCKEKKFSSQVDQAERKLHEFVFVPQRRDGTLAHFAMCGVSFSLMPAITADLIGFCLSSKSMPYCLDGVVWKLYPAAYEFTYILYVRRMKTLGFGEDGKSNKYVISMTRKF